jgi:hypothetical protein
MHGLDEPWSLTLITKRFAQLADTDSWHRLADIGLRPDRLQQLLFGYQLVWVFQQIPQHGKSLAP